MNAFVIVILSALGSAALTGAVVMLPALGSFIELEEEIEGIHE